MIVYKVMKILFKSTDFCSLIWRKGQQRGRILLSFLQDLLLYYRRDHHFHKVLEDQEMPVSIFIKPWTGGGRFGGKVNIQGWWEAGGGALRERTRSAPSSNLNNKDTSRKEKNMHAETAEEETVERVLPDKIKQITATKEWWDLQIKPRGQEQGFC